MAHLLLSPLTFLLINLGALVSSSNLETSLIEKEGLKLAIDSILNRLQTCVLRLTFLETEQTFVTAHVLANVPAILDEFTSMKHENYTYSRFWQHYWSRLHRSTRQVKSRANCSLALLFDTFNSSQCTSIATLRLHGQAMSINSKNPTPFESHYSFFYRITGRPGMTSPLAAAATIHEQFRTATFRFRFKLPAIFIILTAYSGKESISKLNSKYPLMLGWFYCWYCGKDLNFVPFVTPNSNDNLAHDALKTYKMSINGGTNVYWNTDLSGAAAKLTQLTPFCSPANAGNRKNCTWNEFEGTIYALLGHLNYTGQNVQDDVKGSGKIFPQIRYGRQYVTRSFSAFLPTNYSKEFRLITSEGVVAVGASFAKFSISFSASVWFALCCLLFWQKSVTLA